MSDLGRCPKDPRKALPLESAKVRAALWTPHKGGALIEMRDLGCWSKDPRKALPLESAKVRTARWEQLGLCRFGERI